MEIDIASLPEFAKSVAQFFMGLGAAGLAFYGVVRKKKSDTDQDAIIKANLESMTHLQGQLEDEREENANLRVANERISSERNEAVKKYGELNGEVKALKSQVEGLINHIQILEEENRRLTIEIRKMKEDFTHIMKVMAHKIDSGNSENTPS